MKKSIILYIGLIVLTTLNCQYGPLQNPDEIVIVGIGLSNTQPGLDEQIELTVEATDPQGDPLQYKWLVTEGELQNDDLATVLWNTPDKIVPCTIMVMVTDRIPGHMVSASIDITLCDLLRFRADSFGVFLQEADSNFPDTDRIFVTPTSDQGYVYAGNVTDGLFTDFQVIKVNRIGKIEWQKLFHSVLEDSITDIIETKDQGFILTGSTTSYLKSSFNIMAIKLDSAGNIEWQKVYGEDLNDKGGGIIETSDGGYLLAGTTRSFGVRGQPDYIIFKITSLGVLSWAKFYGTNDDEEPTSIKACADGGFFINGYTKGEDGATKGAWVIKLDSDGQPVWNRSINGSRWDVSEFLLPTSDLGALLVGTSSSWSAGGALDFDIWVVKLFSDGTISWQKTYGGPARDTGLAATQTLDGNFIIAGRTNSFSTGDADGWLLKVTGDGSVLWQKRYSSTETEKIFSIFEQSDGNFLASGILHSAAQSTNAILTLRIRDSGICPGWDLSTYIAQRSSTATSTALIPTQVGSILLGDIDTTIMDIFPTDLNLTMTQGL